jgi:hypothetical protein
MSGLAVIHNYGPVQGILILAVYRRAGIVLLNQYVSWIPVRPHTLVMLFQFLEGFDVRIRIDCLTSGHHIHQIQKKL